MKDEIRKTNKQKRREMSKSEVCEKSRLAAEHFLKSDIYKNANCIMLYMPLGNETDTKDIMSAAFLDKKRVALPKTDAESGKITAVFVENGANFEKGAFFVPEPTEWTEADISMIDAVVVPGIAFDKGGARVGFGKGCYDGFLKGLMAVKIGLCYDFQICDKILCEEHDVRMDFIVSESGVIDCRE